jgi:hypothetical protein
VELIVGYLSRRTTRADPMSIPSLLDPLSQPLLLSAVTALTDIQADKRERAEKIAREKALRDGTTTAESSSIPTPASIAKPATNSADNPQTRLQVRLSAGGQPLTKAFPSDSSEFSCADEINHHKLI